MMTASLSVTPLRPVVSQAVTFQHLSVVRESRITDRLGTAVTSSSSTNSWYALLMTVFFFIFLLSIHLIDL